MSWFSSLFSFGKKEQQAAFDAYDWEPRCLICDADDHTMKQCYTYKTKICRHFERGFCAYGQDCVFAHGKSELRVAPEIPLEFKSVVQTYKKK